ncbi:MAG: RagB/SusD family nutrient uptake outer membrane protein, partial [Balneolaceae bacterium]|nr:RagB/SusD family nutrient uptake outer membrane protein [Balneolaceae bacterium]
EGNNNDTESIFEVQFQANTGFGTASNYQNADIPRVTGGNGLYPTMDLLDAYEDGDPRKDWTILEPGDEFAGEIYDPSLQDQNFGITGLVRVKGVIEEKNIQGGQNFIVLRFAEMLINKAEALNEQGNTLDAYAPINRIRNRVGLSDLPAGLTQAEMREAIRHERRVELAFEGQYYFDVLRWGADALEEDMNSVTEINNHDRIFEPKLLVWPIPARELDVNPNLTQHPEWQ